MPSKPPPQLYILAGPNGAGKTSFARQFLPEVGIYEFLNADSIAAGLSPLKPELKALAAGRLLLHRWKELAAAGRDFAVESTLSGKTYLHYIEEARQQGYQIRICYLVLPSVETSMARVRQRVTMGGHDIPEADLRRRFLVGLRNFFELYLPLADEALLFLSKGVPPLLLARWNKGELTIVNQDEYETVIRKVAGEG